MHRCAPVAKQKRVELTLREIEMYKEERDVLKKEMTTDGCDRKVSTLDNSEKTIAILGDR